MRIFVIPSLGEGCMPAGKAGGEVLCTRKFNKSCKKTQYSRVCCIQRDTNGFKQDSSLFNCFAACE